MSFDDVERPECINLLRTYQAVTGKCQQEVEKECSNMNWKSFKILLSDALIDHLGPIQQRYDRVMQDQTELRKVISSGAENANHEASQTLMWTKNAMGFNQPSKQFGKE
jgi:tryptophanyl-tRNA synthetase